MKNLKILICCLGVCCTMPLYSANVVWDGITTWDATECIIGANLGGGRSLSLGLEKSVAGSCSYAYTANFFDMMFAGNWAQARLDDVVSDASFANSAEDMAYTKPYYDSFIVEVGSSASAMANESLYLIFKCGWMYETQTVQDPIYGWVEYNVGEDGTLTYLHSAWDLDGGAMVVGGGSATPEPTSGVLLLFGVALLGLRRRPQKV